MPSEPEAGHPATCCCVMCLPTGPGIVCFECGCRYEPMTDSYTCPVCGEENYPDADHPDYDTLANRADHLRDEAKYEEAR